MLFSIIVRSLLKGIGNLTSVVPIWWELQSVLFSSSILEAIYYYSGSEEQEVFHFFRMVIYMIL